MSCQYTVGRRRAWGGGSCSHILLELLDVGMGVGQSLLELQELLLLALADSKVLLGLLTLLESITAMRERRVSQMNSCSERETELRRAGSRDVPLASGWADGTSVSGAHGTGGRCECANGWARGLDD